MFCSKCGNQVADGSAFCNKCGTALETAPQSNPEPPVNPAPVAEEKPKKKLFGTPTKAGKSFAAIATALMVLPATLCVAIDYIIPRYEWSSYVVGFMLVAWIVTIFPSLKLTPTPVNVALSFVAIMCYFFYIANKTGHFQWFYTYCMPLVLLAALFLSVDAALFSSGKIKPLHILSIISLEIAAYLVAIEATIDNFFISEVNLRWSLIIACFFISAVAVIEAVSYVISLNKKK